MAGVRSVSVHLCGGFSAVRFFKRFVRSLAYFGVFVPAFVFAQAQMSTPGAFAVSPSGAATYTIPIQVPPGTAGMQPTLALTYNSQAGNGSAGMGWSLSGLSAIHRCQATYVQDGFSGGINYDPNDRFCLDGERLILVGGTYGAANSEYRTEHESFSKVTMLAANDFEVRAKSGQIMHYRAMLAAPPKNATAALWVLDEVKDRAGNYLKVYYGENNAIGEFWPDRIEYTGNTAVTSAPYLSVYFKYDARSDVEVDYVAGTPVTSTIRLSHVKTCIGSVECTYGASLVKDYVLTYESALSPSTNRSRLKGIKECDSAGICLVESSFSWMNGNGSFAPIVSSTISAANFNDEWTDMVGDFNGDGKTDLVTVSTSATGFITNVALGLGNGSFAPMVSSTISSANFNGEWTDMVGDFNGDGKTDLVTVSTSTGGFIANVALGLGNGSFAPMVSSTISSANFAGDWTDTLGDFNGDGKTDLITIATTVSGFWAMVAIGRGDGTFAPPVYTSISSANFAGAWIDRIGDFNGDGKTDVVTFSTDTGGFIANVALGLGNGSFAPMVSSTISSANFAGDWTDTLGDFNGDGKTDLITIATTVSGFWAIVAIGHGDGTFAPPVYSVMSSANFNGEWTDMVGDFNGDGKADIVTVSTWTGGFITNIALGLGNGSFAPMVSSTISSANFAGDWTDTLGDFNGDGKTDLAAISTQTSGFIANIAPTSPGASDILSSVNNGLGFQTSVIYKALTDKSIFAKGTGSIYPLMDVQAPIYVASSTSSSNGIGGTLPSSYSYAGLKAHALGRGLLGFASMRVTNDHTGITSTTTYAQDGVCALSRTNLGITYTDYACIGMPLTSEGKFGSTLLSRSTTTPSYTITNPGVYFSYASTVIGDAFAVSNSLVNIPNTPTPTPLSTVTTTTVFGEPTQYGNPTKITVDSGGYVKVTDNLYANDSTIWILGHLLTAAVTSTHPTAATQTRVSSFTYNALGFLASETIEPCPRTNLPPGLTITAACDSKLTLTTSYGYDGFGNKNLATVSGGAVGNISYVAPRTTTSQYDTQGRFPISTTNALNQTETRTFDNKFGGITSLTGPNQIATTWSYDGFGRKTNEGRADTTSSTWTYNATVGSIQGQAYQYSVTATSTGAPTVTSYFDILNRAVVSSRVNFDGGNIFAVTEYDTLGRLKRSPRPFSTGTIYWATPTYDLLGRVQTEINPDGSTVNYDYNGLITTTTKTTGRVNVASIVNKTVRNPQGQVVQVNNADSSTTPSKIDYTYDAFGNLLNTVDQAGTTTSSMTYNIRGFKTAMTDSDLKAWSCSYSALSELMTQNDARGQTTTSGYDLLGRIKSRITPTFTSNWYYDTYANNTACNKGIGKLCEVTTTNSFRRTFLYDSLGRGLETTTYLNNVPYTVTNTYGGCANGVGKVCSVQYPFTYGTMVREKINNVYNAYGYLTSIQDAANSASLWILNGAAAMDADGNILKETLGNGLVTDRLYSPTTGRIQTIKTGNSLIQNLAYGFDQLGDLVSRDDGVNNVHETFAYDALNRLTGTTMTGATGLTKSYGYSIIGNLTYKSDVGTLVYPGPGNLSTHAVQYVTGTVNGLVNPTYSYDAAGNLVTEKTGTAIQRAITWNGFNMPSRIAKGNSTIDFLYDADHARVKETRMTGATVDSQTYFVNAGNSLFFEIETKGTITEWKHYIHAPSGLLMMRSIKSNTTAKTDVYFHKDHLGSITTITNNIGAILEQNSFDAFGKRRNSNGNDATTTINSLTRRGFTEHEMLPEVNMIHMNGRVYEPTLGRFMSADPSVQFAGFSQSYNRYSYSLNNPLSYTDPSGYGLRQFFSSLDNAVRHPGDAQALFGAIRNRPDDGAHDRFMMTHSWARAIGYAIAAYYGGSYATSFITGYETYIAGGSNSDIFRASAIAYQTSEAFRGVGSASSAVGGFWGAVIKVVGSAAVGCVSSESSGGSCRQGAMFSGGFAAADALYQYATIKTDSLKQAACDTGGTICQRNEQGELRTDGARETDWSGNPDRTGNALTRSGMAGEASGKHIYDPDGVIGNRYLARFVNDVSKIHDFFNSANYSSQGLYLSRGAMFDSFFHLYSFSGMPIAGALTAAHYIGENPAMMASQLELRRRRNIND